VTGIVESTVPVESRSADGDIAISVRVALARARTSDRFRVPDVSEAGRRASALMIASGSERVPTVDPPGGRPLRIAFFTDSFPPTHDGVAETTAALSGELAARGHQLTVFTVRLPGEKRLERLPNGVNVRRHLAIAAPSYPQYRVALLPYAPLFLSRRRFDVIHIHTPGFVGLAGYLAARRWGLPAICTFHSDLGGMLAGAGRTSIARAFFREWARFNLDLCLSCDAATAPTLAACAQLTAARTPRRPPVVIENGVDIGRFRPEATSPDWHDRLGVSPDRPFVTFLGRLTRDKGVLRFLDAMGDLPSKVPSFAIVGGAGPLGPAVTARFAPGARLANRGRFVGVVPDPEKAALLAQSRVFVLTSLSDTSSVALLEAMACGAACVVTNRGGPAEIARRSGAGILVDPEDILALRQAIQELLLNPARAAGLAQRGRIWVTAEASIERTANRFDHLYREILADRRSGDAPGSIR
jgi:glycosyltransferase involved in cell wall biosynthesis